MTHADPAREARLMDKAGILSVINSADNDETGAGFTVDLILNSGHILREIALLIPAEGYTAEHRTLYGETTLDAEPMELAIAVRSIAAVMIVW